MVGADLHSVLCAWFGVPKHFAVLVEPDGQLFIAGPVHFVF